MSHFGPVRKRVPRPRVGLVSEGVLTLLTYLQPVRDGPLEAMYLQSVQSPHGPDHETCPRGERVGVLTVSTMPNQDKPQFRVGDVVEYRGDRCRVVAVMGTTPTIEPLDAVGFRSAVPARDVTLIHEARLVP